MIYVAIHHNSCNVVTVWTQQTYLSCSKYLHIHTQTWHTQDGKRYRSFARQENIGVLKILITHLFYGTIFVLFLITKVSNKTQGPNVFFFTLLVILGNYESWSIVFIVEAGELIKVKYNFHCALRDFLVDAIFSYGRSVNQNQV